MARKLEITDSSNISGIAYDHGTRIMMVQFTNGDLYEYKEVPGDVFGTLASAQSVGKKFAKFRGIFTGRKISK